MSFSSDIKEKITEVRYKCKDCPIYELSGMISNFCRINDDSLIIKFENENNIKRVREIIERLYSYKFDGESNGLIITDVHVAERVIKDTAMLDSMIVTEKDCCKGAYIRGAFLACGSISNPQKSYHMEFDYKTKFHAQKLVGIFGELGITAKITERKKHFVVYVKGYEMIAGILGCIGAGSAAMEIFYISAEKDLKNKINRQMNFENANMDKVAAAYLRHIAAIEKIDAVMGINKLPESLREAAEIRINNPEESLKELCTKFKKPIGKSGVNHRLNRLIEIADNL